jgi:hypothetical protein
MRAGISTLVLAKRPPMSKAAAGQVAEYLAMCLLFG